MRRGILLAELGDCHFLRVHPRSTEDAETEPVSAPVAQHHLIVSHTAGSPSLMAPLTRNRMYVLYIQYSCDPILACSIVYTVRHTLAMVTSILGTNLATNLPSPTVTITASAPLQHQTNNNTRANHCSACQSLQPLNHSVGE
jgi:hypothetical protein